jgi:hypothetical protein
MNSDPVWTIEQGCWKEQSFRSEEPPDLYSSVASRSADEGAVIAVAVVDVTKVIAYA